VIWGLLGSGEFLPWTADVDRWLLERASGEGRVLVLPTASAPEGDDVFDRWGTMGVEHYRGLRIDAEVVPLKTRRDAEGPDLVPALDGASMAFFSGGNPAYLAATLEGTAFWRALLESLERGLAYAGCSAGISCLGEVTGDSASMRVSDRTPRPGLRAFPGTHFGPHWDMLGKFVPGLKTFIVSAVGPGERLVAVDNETALVGDGIEWQVMGAGGVHVLDASGWTDHAAGSSFTLPLRP
jgi:cyanophycinase-like exopeptidase